MAAKSGGDLYRKKRSQLTEFEAELARVGSRASQLRHQRRIQGDAFRSHGALIFYELRFSQLQEMAREQGYETRKQTRLEERQAKRKAEQEKLNAPVPEPSGWEAWSAGDDVA